MFWTLLNWKIVNIESAPQWKRGEKQTFESTTYESPSSGYSIVIEDTLCIKIYTWNPKQGHAAPSGPRRIHTFCHSLRFRFGNTRSTLYMSHFWPSLKLIGFYTELGQCSSIYIG